VKENLVERLRGLSVFALNGPNTNELVAQAADRIEALEAGHRAALDALERFQPYLAQDRHGYVATAIVAHMAKASRDALDPSSQALAEKGAPQP
jgi:hypothetical protein